MKTKDNTPVKAGGLKTKVHKMSETKVLIIANVILWFAILPLISHFI